MGHICPIGRSGVKANKSNDTCGGGISGNLMGTSASIQYFLNFELKYQKDKISYANLNIFTSCFTQIHLYYPIRFDFIIINLPITVANKNYQQDHQNNGDYEDKIQNIAASCQEYKKYIPPLHISNQ